MAINPDSTNGRPLLGAKILYPGMSRRERMKLRIADEFMRLENGILSGLRKLLYQTIKSPSKILLFRTGSIGDSVCAIPAIQVLSDSYPGASIDILTNAGGKNLIGLPYLLDASLYNQVIDYYGYPQKQLLGLLRKGHYDLVLQLPQVDASFFSLLRDLIIFRFVSRSGFGWKMAQSRWFRSIQAKYLEFPDERKRLVDLLRQHGLTAAESPVRVKPGSEDQAKAFEVLEQLGLPGFDPLIAVVAGAKRPQNRWPLSYFYQVVERMTAHAPVILVGSAEDGLLVQPLLSISGVYNACGKLTPMQSASVLGLCKLTISNDTGPMHLSYAVGTPTIAIFSGRDLPGKWYPPREGNYVFRPERTLCESCFDKSCEKNECMQSILPSTIIACAEKVLSQAPVPA